VHNLCVVDSGNILEFVKGYKPSNKKQWHLGPRV
jgi:hypothetical protein